MSYLGLLKVLTVWGCYVAVFGVYLPSPTPIFRRIFIPVNLLGMATLAVLVIFNQQT